jgi:hypothetical protein
MWEKRSGSRRSRGCRVKLVNHRLYVFDNDVRRPMNEVRPVIVREVGRNTVDENETADIGSYCLFDDDIDESANSQSRDSEHDSNP